MWETVYRVGYIVERIEAKGMDEFEGTVKSVELEHSANDRKQYHIKIDATSLKVGGATGLIHEWIPLSNKSSDSGVMQGSVLDRFLAQIELIVTGAKKAATVQEELNMLIGKKFRFKRMKLGRDYNGQEAREYIVPAVLLA